MKSPRATEEKPAAAEAAPTKQVRVYLSAYTLVERVEVIEVPADTSDEYLDDLVRDRYQNVDSSDFRRKEDYWEKSECKWSLSAPSSIPDYRLVPDPEFEGDLMLEPVDLMAASAPVPSIE